MKVMNEDIMALLDRQLSEWDTAQNNYVALQNVQIKEVQVEGVRYKVQFNPARIVSSGAKVDTVSIQARKCFLCEENRPSVQEGILFKGHYQILVNPFPIFPRHLTIPETTHTPQRIEGRFEDMLELAQALTDYTLFYNGPKCGASAPDHAHFQAGSKWFMPIETVWKTLPKSEVTRYNDGVLYRLNEAHRSTLVITARTIESASHLFNAIFRTLPQTSEKEEPMINLLTWYEEMQWTVCVFPRSKHRPDCYYAEGIENLLCSPASVDLGGVFITPRETDFQRITAAHIGQILTEICVSSEEMTRICQQIKEHIHTA